MGWGGSKSDFRWTISEAYHPTLISGIVPNYPLNRPFGSISDCSLFSIERSVFTWRHSSRDWRVISPDIFDPVPPRDRASKKVTTGSRSSCMKHNSVLCPPLSLSALSPPVLEILFPRQHFQSVWLNEIRNDARDTVGKTHFWCSRRRISKKPWVGYPRMKITVVRLLGNLLATHMGRGNRDERIFSKIFPLQANVIEAVLKCHERNSLFVSPQRNI